MFELSGPRHKLHESWADRGAPRRSQKHLRRAPRICAVTTIGYHVSARATRREAVADGAGGDHEPSNLQYPTRKMFAEVREF